MEIPIRAGVGTLLCLGLTSCAALAPAVFLPQLAVGLGVAGISGVTCANDPLCEVQASRCHAFEGQDIELTGPPAIAVPADEGKVAAFAPAYWQPQFESASNARANETADASPGTLVVTDKSATFIARSAMSGIRLPLAAILNVEIQRNAASAPRQLTVESCFGRLDRFVFGQREQPGRLDSEATAAAAAEIKRRVAAPSPTSRKEIAAGE